MYTQQFLSLLAESSNCPIFISTHKFCDGDGLGAGLALYHALNNKNVCFMTLESPQPKYDFLIKKAPVKVFDKNTTQIPNNSVFIFVDVNDSLLIEPLYSLAKKAKARVYFIDHHPLNQHKTEDVFFIDTNSSSTAELIYILLKSLKIPINQNIATCLFTSIVFDTNLFRDIKNSARPFSICAELMPQIKDVNLIYDNLFKTLSIDKIKFMAELQKTSYHANGEVAFLHLKEEDFKKYNTDSNQAYDLMDIVRDVKSIKSTALVIEHQDGSFKLSLRSKSKNLLPLAKSFNGGGHCHSAGAYIKNQTLKDIKNKVLSFLIP